MRQSFGADVFREAIVEQASAREYPNATGRRIVAALIDLVILSIVFGVMVWLFGEHETYHTTTTGSGRYGESTGTQFNLTGLPLLVYLAILVAYYIGFEAARRATPGKMVMGLRVVSLNAEPLSFGRIVLRNVLRVIDGLPFLYLVGIITISASKAHQRVGDMAAGTNVAYEAKTESLVDPPHSPEGESPTP